MQAHDHQAGAAIVDDLGHFFRRISVHNERFGPGPFRDRLNQLPQAVFGDGAPARSQARHVDPPVQMTPHVLDDMNQEQTRMHRLGDSARDFHLIRR